MSRGGGLPDAEWFERIADGSGLIFYILRIRPDTAFEYLGSALQTRLGIVTSPGAPVDTAAVLGRIDPDSADRLAAALALVPGQELSVDLTWRHLDGYSVHSRAWMRASQRADGSVVQEGVVEDITELREVEAELRRSEQRHRLLAEVDDDGQVVEILGVTRDISARKVFETELTRLAETDPVTGVWNRRHGRELLEIAAAQPEQEGPLSVLMIDIDTFKAINDTYGHEAGDTVLIELARRLTGAVRGTDMVARWGGEEFVVLLHDCPLDSAVTHAESIRRQVADVPFPGVGIVTVSIGAAQLAPHEDAASWLARSDRALYQAKRSGRNTVVAGERR